MYFIFSAVPMLSNPDLPQIVATSYRYFLRLYIYVNTLLFTYYVSTL